jgi:hypothetical protein
MSDTRAEYDQAVKICKDIFMKKMQDYGASWRVFRLSSLVDQLYIKANRIRTLEQKSLSLVGEGIYPEYIGIVNYSIIALIQIELGISDTDDLTVEKAEHLYDRHFMETRDLMLRKNHDYGEAWRSMQISSFTDMILVKLLRIRQILDNKGKTVASEGIDANLHDMINYSVFALIKMQG